MKGTVSTHANATAAVSTDQTSDVESAICAVSSQPVLASQDEPALSELTAAEIAHIGSPFWSHGQAMPGTWDSLPYERLGGAGFERLCFHILLLRGHVPRYFGVNGQAQHGIDLLVGDGLSYTVYQCKNTRQFRSSLLEKWLGHFEREWLTRRADTLPKPNKFVLCCPIDLREREELELARTGFASRTGVGVEVWDQNILDAHLRRHPDVVADAFGDHVAERFCQATSWNSGLFRALVPGSGDKRTVDRYLDLRSRKHVVRDPMIAEQFAHLMRRQRVVLILGASGSGKTITALDLAESLEHGSRRVFVIGDWLNADDDSVVDGVKARGCRPTVFLLDDTHDDFEKASRIVRRCLHACRGRPIGLVLTAHTARQPAEQLADPESDLIEECLATESVIHLAPNEQLFAAIIARVRPDLAQTTQSAIQRLWDLVAGDLALLQQTLEMVEPPETLENIDLDELSDVTLKRYFGRKSIDARNIEYLAAIGQFDIPIPVGLLGKPVEPAHHLAVQRLLVEDGRPLAYRFAHRALGELVFQALCRAHAHSDSTAILTQHVLAFLRESDMQRRSQPSRILKALLSTRLRLMNHAIFRKQLLAHPTIVATIAALENEERLQLLNLAAQMTHDTDAGEAYRRQLTDALLSASAACSQANAYTVVNVLIQFLQTLRRSAADQAQELEQAIGAANLIRLIRASGTIFDLLKLLKRGSGQFALDLLEEINGPIAEELIDRTILANRAIGTIALHLRELAARVLPDGRNQLHAFQEKLGAEAILRLVRTSGTLVDLMKCLSAGAQPITHCMLVRLDENTVEEIVSRTVDTGRSLGTVGLALRELARRKMSNGRSQLESFETKLGVRHLLHLLRHNGTFVDLLSVLHNASTSFAGALLEEVDRPTVHDLIRRAIDDCRSIGTCNLALKRMRQHVPEGLRRLLSLVGESSWWELLLSNGDLDDLVRIVGDLPESERVLLLRSSASFESSDWSRMVERSSFQSICRFLYYDLAFMPNDARGPLEAQLRFAAASAAARANWFGLAKGLATLEDVAATPCRDELQRAAFSRLDGASLQGISFDEPSEAINFVSCMWWQRPHRRSELASYLWSLLPDETKWSKDHRLLISARFLLRICCDQVIPQEAALRSLRAFAPLPDRFSLRKLHSTPLFLFLWNLYALWFERGGAIAATFEALQPQTFWDAVVEAVGERVRQRGTWQDRVDHLALAGALAVLVPSTRERIQRNLREAVSRSREMEKTIKGMTFVPAFFAFRGLALVAPVERVTYNARRRQLRQKLEQYENIGPALKALSASL